MCNERRMFFLSLIHEWNAINDNRLSWRKELKSYPLELKSWRKLPWRCFHILLSFVRELYPKAFQQYQSLKVDPCRVVMPPRNLWNPWSVKCQRFNPAIHCPTVVTLARRSSPLVSPAVQLQILLRGADFPISFCRIFSMKIFPQGLVLSFFVLKKNDFPFSGRTNGGEKEKIVVCALESGYNLLPEKKKNENRSFNSFSSMISHLTLEVNYVKKSFSIISLIELNTKGRAWWSKARCEDELSLIE